MHVVIIDGLNLIRRVHAAVAASPTEVLDVQRLAETCRSSLAKVLKRRQPSHALCVMDSAGRSWRHELFPDYKANRDPMPEPLRDALGDILQAFETLAVRSIHKDGFEADDVIATAASRIADAKGQVTIASTDKSFCQLLGECISVYDHFSDRFLDGDYVMQRFGVEPTFLATLFALTGNASVNVPGVRSVGPRTAAELIQKFGDLEAILEAAAGMKDRVGSRLRADQDAARLAMRLFSLRTDLELGLNLRDFRCH
jgi:protein Xni